MQKVVSNHTGAMAFGAEKIYKRQQESDNWQTSFENETIKNDKWQRHMTSLHYTKVQLVTAGKLENNNLLPD